MESTTCDLDNLFSLQLLDFAWLIPNLGALFSLRSLVRIIASLSLEMATPGKDNSVLIQTNCVLVTTGYLNNILQINLSEISLGEIILSLSGSKAKLIMEENSSHKKLSAGCDNPRVFLSARNTQNIITKFLVKFSFFWQEYWVCICAHLRLRISNT